MLRSHRITCSRSPRPPFVFLRRATPSHFHLQRGLLDFRRAMHARTPARCPHAHARSPFPDFPHARSLSARACPLAVSRTPVRCPHAHARSPFPDSPHAHACSSSPARPRPLVVSRTPVRCLMPPPPPRASPLPRASPPPRAPLCLASLRFASLHFASLPFASLGFGSPVKPSQVPNAIRTGYRMSRVWIWSSKNGRQGGIGQPSQEWYQCDEETNSVKEE
jgi:hypothetical protein